MRVGSFSYLFILLELLLSAEADIPDLLRKTFSNTQGQDEIDCVFTVIPKNKSVPFLR